MVKTIRVGVQCVREARAAQLQKDFDDITFNEGESIDDFALRIVGPGNKIRVLNGDITDAEIVKKMLQVVPDHLSQITIAIETFLDCDTLIMEEVVGRLHQVEEQKHKKTAPPPMPIVDKQGRLLLSEEWLARLNRHDSNGDEGSSSGNKRRGKLCRGRHGGGRHDDRSNSSTSTGKEWPPSNSPCFKCSRTSHCAKDCRNKGKKAQAHVAQGEEEEPTLLMAQASVSTRTASPPPLPSATTTPPPASHRVVEI